VVEANQGANAGEIHAVRVKSCAGGAGCHGQGLRSPVEVEDGAGFAMWANGLNALAGMQAVRQERHRGSTGNVRQWDRQGWRGRTNWGGPRRLGKVGRACAWDRLLVNLMHRRQAWLDGFEGKMPEPRTLTFPPSLEDTPAVGIDDGDICLGERDGAA
jgi:hypothetical protein